MVVVIGQGEGIIFKTLKLVSGSAEKVQSELIDMSFKMGNVEIEAYDPEEDVVRFAARNGKLL